MVVSSRWGPRQPDVNRLQHQANKQKNKHSPDRLRACRRRRRRCSNAPAAAAHCIQTVHTAHVQHQLCRPAGVGHKVPAVSAHDEDWMQMQPSLTAIAPHARAHEHLLQAQKPSAPPRPRSAVPHQLVIIPSTIIMHTAVQ